MPNWIRQCSLEVGGSAGSTLDLSGLRIRFETVTHTGQELAAGQFIISNASRETAQKVINEFTSITLKCGYRDGPAPGVIFSGTIVETQYGEREGWTDPLLRIWARDGQGGYQSQVSTTLAAGATPQDIVNTCLKAMEPSGITMGQVVGVSLSTPKFPRAYVLAGMARDYLREVATSKRCTFDLNGGKLNLIAKGVAVPGGPIVLSSDTGLIGQVIERTEGIIATCYINPAIGVNTMLQIDQKSIVQTKITNTSLSAEEGDKAAELNTLGVNDGTYRVLQVKVSGDNRGDAGSPWFQTLTLIGAVTGTPNTTQSTQGLGMGLS